jgi:hypothetical protein
MESHKPVDVTKLSDQEAIDYFFDKGVPLWYFKELKVGAEGLSPDEKHHFGEALNGHLGMLYTHTPAGHQLADSIISYLQGALGYETRDIKKNSNTAELGSRRRKRTLDEQLVAVSLGCV